MKMLETINQLYPNSKFVKINKYEPSIWEKVPYDSRIENKAPLTAWRKKPLNIHQAMALAKQGWRIGWVIPNGYVCVDVDNEDHPESSAKLERLLNDLQIEYNYNRTFRGVHFLFKDENKIQNSKTSFVCSLGITVDYRANDGAYIILPVNDPHRYMGHWSATIDSMPNFLNSVMSAPSPQNFINLSEGESRNNELFTWRTRLIKSGKFDLDEIDEILIFINKYIFKIPLPDKEMEATVLRRREDDEELLANAKTVKGRTAADFLSRPNAHNAIANKFLTRNDIISIDFNNFYRFTGSYYEKLKPIEMEQILHFDMSQNLSGSARNEIMKFLAVKTYIDVKQLDNVWNRISVKNGVLDVVTGELCEPRKEDVNTIYIPHEYKEDVEYSPAIDEFMTHISAESDGTPNERKKQFLYQIAGYCLLKKNIFSKFFIFKGEGGTGKSTFQDLIVKMVGEDNRSRVALDKMDQDYFLATVLGKLVNIDDDAVDGKALENTGRFKSMVSGNEITVRQIFERPITFEPFCTLLFSCNKLPRIRDKTTGLYRRMVIIEMNHRVEKPDPLFLMKLTPRDMEYFLYNAVKWVGIAIQEGKFRISVSEGELLRQFKCRQSSLNEWLYEEDLTLAKFYKQSVNVMYALYTDWALANGYTHLPSMLSFKEDINALFGTIAVTENDPLTKGRRQIFTCNYVPIEEDLKRRAF